VAKRQRQNKPQRFVSKHQLSKWERQKRMSRITLILGLIVIISVVAIIGGGTYKTQVYPYTRPVVKVNGTTFNMRYYVNTLKLYRSQGNLDFNVADGVEKQIEQQELARQAAKALGFQVSRSDAEAEVKKAGLSVSRELVDVQMTRMLIDKLREEYFKPKVPAEQAQVNLQAMLLESEGIANKAKARIAAGEDFTKIAEELSREGITKFKKGDLGWVARDEIGLTVDSTKLAELAFGADAGKVSGPTFDDTVTKDFGYWVVKVIEKTEATENPSTPRRVHPIGILVGSEQEAQDVISRLNSGTDFDVLAKEVSQQPGVKDGNISPDMGWIDFSDQLGDFEKGLFDLPLEKLSGPIGDSNSFTRGGHWLIRVVEKADNRALSDEQRDAMVADLINKWVDGVTKDPNNKVENLLTQETKTFALIQALSGK